MKDILSLARAHVFTALRERETLFWNLIFPLFLLTILCLIFGRMTDGQDIHLSIALISDPSAHSTDAFSASAMVEEAFAKLASPTQEGRQPLFTVQMPEHGQDRDEYLEQKLVELRRGHIAAVLVLAEDFDHLVMSSLSAADGPSSTEAYVYMSATSVASETAASIIEQVLAGIDRGLLARAGRFDESRAIAQATNWIGEEESEVKYVDFVLPGILLMAFFVNGLFSVPGTILFNRDRKVLRQYWVTPLSVGRYLMGFGVGHVLLCILQFALIVTLGKLAFGATISLFGANTLFILSLAAVTFMAFGFLIASFAKSANAGMATANILNMPMMFLSGMFFPITGLPSFMRVVVLANPVTYLLESLRQSVGVQSGTLMPWPWTFVVPMIWIGICACAALGRLRWDVER